MPSPRSYILCGTPRTGSTLLCSLLCSTGVAGRPDSYFREPDQQRWTTHFGVPITEDGQFDYAEFVRSAVQFGSTPNAVFAARIMWGTMHRLVDGLNPHPNERSDVDVLEDAFGPLRFVHLRRRDVVGQAVSWARAEQSGYWQQGDKAQADARLDLDQIDALVATIHEHNDAWRTWFAAGAVEPLDVTYETLVCRPGQTVTRILDFIKVEPPTDWIPESPHRQQADAMNADWVRRYRAPHG